MQLYEQELGLDVGDVSGSATKLRRFTADVNLALDAYTGIAIRSSGKWQYDDSNHSDFPIITTNIVSGQRSYTFLADEQSNLILDIQRVLVADSTGVYKELDAVDAQSGDTSGFWDGNDLTGTPSRYDKTANGIFLDAIPNYNATNGLKIYINREGSYFSYTDTTKKPGVPGIHHAYFYLKPAYEHARRNSLAMFPRLRDEITLWEGNEAAGIKGKIEMYYAERSRDEKRALQVLVENNR